MKKSLSLILALTMSMFISVNAAEFYASISASSFDDEGEGVVWVAAPGFDYGWNTQVPAANMYSNERNTITVYIDGWEECIGDVKIQVGRLSFTAWNFNDAVQYYGNVDEGALKPALTAADFTDGQLKLEIPIPAGAKPWNTYDDNEAEEFRPWTIQVVGSNSSTEHECGETYMNFVFDVSEEITGNTAVSKVVTEKAIAYPNPVNKGELVNINAKAFTGNVDVTVYSIIGAEVFSGSKSANNIQIDTENLSSGMYNVVIKSEGKTASQKIMVR